MLISIPTKQIFILTFQVLSAASYQHNIHFLGNNNNNVSTIIRESPGRTPYIYCDKAEWIQNILKA